MCRVLSKYLINPNQPSQLQFCTVVYRLTWNIFKNMQYARAHGHPPLTWSCNCVVVRDCYLILMINNPLTGWSLTNYYMVTGKILFSLVTDFSSLVDNCMATFQVTSTEPFNFSCPADWVTWIRQSEHFQIASGIAKHSKLTHSSI